MCMSQKLPPMSGVALRYDTGEAHAHRLCVTSLIGGMNEGQ